MRALRALIARLREVARRLAPDESAAAWAVARAPWIVAVAVLAGLLIPPLAAGLRPWAVPAATAIVLISALRVDPATPGAAAGRPMQVLAVAALALLALPLLAGWIAWAVGAPGWLSAGLALAAAAPPVSSAALAGFVGVEAALVTAVGLPATLASPATLAVVTALMPGSDAVDATTLVARFAFVVFGAFGVAFFLRRTVEPAALARWTPSLDAARTGLAALVAVGVTHEIDEALRTAPLTWLGILVAALALGAASAAAAMRLFRGWGADAAAAAGLSAGARNMAVTVAAVLGAVDPKVALVVITAQLPLLLSPILLKPALAAMRRLPGLGG